MGPSVGPPFSRPLRLHVVDGGAEPDQRLHQLVPVGRAGAQDRRCDGSSPPPHGRAAPAPRASGATPPPAGRRRRPTGAAGPRCAEGLDGGTHRRLADGQPVGHPGSALVARGDGREHPVVGQAQLARGPFEDPGGPGQGPDGPQSIASSRFARRRRRVDLTGPAIPR